MLKKLEKAKKRSAITFEGGTKKKKVPPKETRPERKRHLQGRSYNSPPRAEREMGASEEKKAPQRNGGFYKSEKA